MNIYYVKKLIGKKHLLHRHFEEEKEEKKVGREKKHSQYTQME